ncbi:ABC transporter substrate-binding protein [Microbacterium oryzae]|uniref:ABC transporter substrate-binding protein n=1 Tax=Microbacterium oryzae TaxID=743009 RepID=UPI0025B0DD6A|nr:ABC transporter substrate-binding protein [Microbacterium oryzae]MDN3310206.1 ABC transporter substrate-binding protein [Microbacterium oryzae]
MSRTRITSVSTVGLAIAGLLLAGCSAENGSSAEATPELDPDDPVAIEVLQSAGGQFESLLLGIEQGFFAEEGLDLNVTVGTGNPATIAPQLVSGQIQFAQIDAASPIAAVSQGIPISLVSVIQNDDPEVTPSAGLLVPPGSDVTSVADLEGKTIATGQLAGLPVVSTNLALTAAGVPLDSIEWVQLTPDALPDAATSGQADAILTYASFFAGARESGFTFLEETSTSATLPEVTQVAWGASDAYLEENPEVVAAFIRATDRANEYANENPDEVRRIDREQTELPDDYIESREIQPFGGSFHVDVMQQLADAMLDQGFSDEAVDVADDLLWSEADQD